MIKKFIEIKGVGRFSDYNTRGNGDVELRPSTIIYAENGQGKTTLTNIIRSLSTGDSNQILNRKTVGGINQTIKIQTDSSVFNFNNSAWQPTSSTLPKVEIFDIFFVNENIYSGFDQSLVQGKNLYKFVVGEEGVRLAKEVKIIKDEIENKNKVLRGLSVSIQKEIGRYNIDEFLGLTEIQNIDAQIQSVSNQIEIAKENEAINNTVELQTLGYINVPFDQELLSDLLISTIDTISESFIKSVDNHKAKLSNNGLDKPGVWITQGFKTINLENTTHDCPFCNQVLDNEDSLLEAYKQYFSDSFISLHHKISEIKTIIESFNLSTHLLHTQKLISINEALTAFWQKYIQYEFNNLSIDLPTSNLQALFSDINKLVKEKTENLLIQKNINSIEEFFRTINDFNIKINQYNSYVTQLNAKIKELKLNNPNLSNLEQSHQVLLLTKRRFNDLKDGCDDFLAIKGAIVTDNLEKDRLQKALSDETENFFERYGIKINEYINKLMPRSNYALQKISSTYSGSSKEPAIQYSLTLNGTAISATENGTTPSFKYTLSEGDKTALAFAFFLSKLDLQDIADNVIVFDDPISSLDKQRRKRTITAITNLIGRAKQVITLSHNENFVYDLYEHNNSGNPKMLKIVYGGKIEEFTNIEEEMESDYFKSLKVFDDFIDNPQSEKIENVIAKIRIALENNIKFRFHKFLKNTYTKPDGTSVGPFTNKSGLGKMIDILEASDCTFRTAKSSVISSLRELNSISMNDHHGTIDRDHRTEPMDSSEAAGYIGDTLQMIYYSL